MRAAALLLALFAATAAWAEDCARFDDPLAYNACLARQGPAAPIVRTGPAPAAAPRGLAPRPVLRAGPYRAIRAAPRRGRGGRSEMVFPLRRR